jgi:hypothetical protein
MTSLERAEQILTGIAQNMAIAPGLVVALDDIYERLPADHPDLPRALVTVEEPHPAVTCRIACWRPGEIATRAGVFAGRIAFGYPSAHRNVPRVLFTGGGPAALEIIAHEAAHALATARGIKDTSRGGQYHNKHYRDLAAELGLDVRYTKNRGWTDTWPSDALLARHRLELDAVAAALPH